MSSTPTRSRARRSGGKGRKRRHSGGDFLRLALLVGGLICVGGGLVVLWGHGSRPVFQAFFAAFPENLRTPGRGELLVRLTNPLTGAPLDGQVRVLVKGARKYKEIGFGRVDGEGAVAYTVPDLKLGRYSLVARLEGTSQDEELSHEIENEQANRVQIVTDRRFVLPGDTVRYLALATTVLPRRPVAGAPAQFQVKDPGASLLVDTTGATSAEGLLGGSFTLPLNARGGIYPITVVVGGKGRKMAGYAEVQVPPVPPPLRVRPVLSGLGARAGTPWEGRVRVAWPDGSVCQPEWVDLVVERESWMVEGGEGPRFRTRARSVGPGEFAWRITLPAMVATEAVPRILRCRIEVPSPDGRRLLQIPFNHRVYRHSHHVEVEGPWRFVAGLPHRLRLMPRALDGSRPGGRVQVRVEGAPEILAEVTCAPGRPSGVEITPPAGAGSLLFSLVDGEGRTLGTSRLALEAPEEKGVDFTVGLPRPRVAAGEGLVVLIRSARPRDRLHLDLVSEGMITATTVVEVREGKARVEIPPARVPEGLFSVQAWRLDDGIVHAHQAPGIGLATNQVDRNPAVHSPGPRRLEVRFPEADTSRILYTAYADPTEVHLALPGEQLTVPELPGCSTLGSMDLRRVAEGLRGQGLIPRFREETPVTVKDSWSTPRAPGTLNGPQQVTRANLITTLGWIGVFVGALLIAAGAVNYLVAVARFRRAAATLLGLALLVPAMPAQEKGAARPTLTLQPWSPAPLAWRLVGGDQDALPSFYAGPSGRVYLSLGGQSARRGGILLGGAARELSASPALVCPARGPLWPGDRVQLPLWLRAPSPPARWRGASIPGAATAGPWKGWHRLLLPLTQVPPKGLRLTALDGEGRVVIDRTLPLTRATPASPRGWSGGPFATPLAVRGDRLHLYPHPLHLAHDHLARGVDDPTWTGSVEQVLGRGRTALAVLRALGREPLPAPFRERLAGVAGRALHRCYLELTGFQVGGGTFAAFPGGTPDLYATAAALEFMIDALPRGVSASLPAMISRTTQALRRRVTKEGWVIPRTEYRTRGFWQDQDGGRYYLTASIGTALARHHRLPGATRIVSSTLMARMADALALPVTRELTRLERLTRIRFLMALGRKRQVVEPLVKEVAKVGWDALSGQGMPTWPGAFRDRANLEFGARLGRILSILEEEGSVAWIRPLLGRLANGPGWGDAWTSAACFEALLAVNENWGWQPGTRLTWKLMQGDRQVRGGATAEAVTLDRLPAGKLVLQGGLPGSVALVERRPPAADGARAPLRLALDPVPGRGAVLDRPFDCALSLGSRRVHHLSRVVVFMPRTACFTFIPSALHRAVAGGEVTRVRTLPGGTELWFNLLPPGRTTLLKLRFIPRVLGTAHLPPLRARALVGGGPAVWTEPKPVTIKG